MPRKKTNTTTGDVEEGDKIIITKKFEPTPKKTLSGIVEEHKDDGLFRKGLKVGVHYVFTLLEKHYHTDFPYNKKLKRTIFPTIEQLIENNPEEYQKVLALHTPKILKDNKYNKVYIHLDGMNKDELRNLIQQEDQKRKEEGTWTGVSVLKNYSSKTKQELYDFLLTLGYQP